MPAAAPPRDDLSLTFAALADPTRRAILAALADGDATVTTLAAPFTISLPAVSRHLKVLERAHLIERSKHAQWRPCHLSPEPLKGAADWVERYRELWEVRLDRLHNYLDELQEAPPMPESDPAPAQRQKETRRDRK